MGNKSLCNILYFIFSLSGFTGLIYESIWSHYLKLFLGHAAYAQVLVLVIFMGGMSIGAWLAARHTYKWLNLLIVYALIEGIVGIFGVTFHDLFHQVEIYSFEVVIPALSNPAWVHLYKWTIGALLILPQSLLLGMTFPLMSNGIIRIYSKDPGRTLSMLYFTNSIGAAIGVLFSGFYLIEKVGLPGTVLTAGIINIFLSITVYFLVKNKTGSISGDEISISNRIPILWLLAAFITGAASFVYEIAWIRMLSMVLGSSTHAFELMLSAFITGLAFGGLWIRKRIDTLKDKGYSAGIIQIAMGICALLTIPLYNYTFEIMGFLMNSLSRSESGYLVFNLGSHFICLLVMLPATFFAGMTLPLFTLILLQQNYGEKSIGHIYAFNTLGAIAGTVFTVFVAMPFMGLKFTMVFGSTMDLMLGVFLLAVATKRNLVSAKFINPAFISICLIIAISVFSGFDIRKMMSTVYRHGDYMRAKNTEILFHKDGRTASVAVNKWDGDVVMITTNGKPDASINMKDMTEPAWDESTMLVTGILPLALNPDARQIANIGMGSGLTTQMLLSWPGVERVDTIEIEEAMVQGAMNFRPRVEKTFSDPRSHIYIEDAKTFFSIYQKQYDIIVSEPSNPWVSGVSSLFTDEFYHSVRKYIKPGGLLVQWIQVYEIDEDLIFSILKALSENFYDYNIYATDVSNIVIVASVDKTLDLPGSEIFSSDELALNLGNIGIKNIQDLYARFLLNKDFLDAYIENTKVNKNSDYFPIVDLNAQRTRFLKQNAYEILNVRNYDFPIIQYFHRNLDSNGITSISSGGSYSYANHAARAENIRDYLRGEKIETILSNELIKYGILIEKSSGCTPFINPDIWIDSLFNLIISTVSYLEPDEIEDLLNIVTPRCENLMNENQIAWLGLYRAIGEHNYGKIAKYSSALLSIGGKWSVQQRHFLFSALFTSLIKLEEYKQALYLWDRYLTKISPEVTKVPLILEILHSIATQSNINNQPR